MDSGASRVGTCENLQSVSRPELVGAHAVARTCREFTRDMVSNPSHAVPSQN